MQGALSLDEALQRPLEPCPICLRKLQHVVGFKLIERYRVSPNHPVPPGAGPGQGQVGSAQTSALKVLQQPGEGRRFQEIPGAVSAGC